jgi:hypothetical protein
LIRDIIEEGCRLSSECPRARWHAQQPARSDHPAHATLQVLVPTLADDA